MAVKISRHFCRYVYNGNKLSSNGLQRHHQIKKHRLFVNIYLCVFFAVLLAVAVAIATAVESKWIRVEIKNNKKKQWKSILHIS